MNKLLSEHLLSHSIALSFFAVLSSHTYAAPQDLDIPLSGPTDQATELNNREGQTTLLDNTVPSAKVTKADIQQAIKKQQLEAQKFTYDLEALKADPILFTKYLNDALAAQDMTTVKQLLPHYKALSNNDPMLIKFADALVYRSEGKNKQAINIYREMLANDPEFHPVRLNMAMAMLADKQYGAAKDQLQKLQAADLPAPIMATVKNALANIERVEEWSFDVSASYIRDDNINDAPSKSVQTGLGRSVEQKTANGIQASASATKRFNLSQNYYATLGGNASLKGYWDEHDYNDYLFTASAGLGYNDAKNDLSVTPFVTKRVFDEAAYSTRKGVTLRASRWVKPKLKVTASSVLSNETFDEQRNKSRETDGRFFGLNGLYTKDAKQYFFGGLGNYRNDVPKSSIISYDTNSINMGWGREWKQGISTLATLGYSVKKYDDPADSFAPGSGGYIAYYQSVGAMPGTLREDKTTSVGLQVWKRDFTLYGLTPRLVFDYDTTSSNFAYYDDRDEKSATIVLTKSF